MRTLWRGPHILLQVSLDTHLDILDDHREFFHFFLSGIVEPFQFLDGVGRFLDVLQAVCQIGVQVFHLSAEACVEFGYLGFELVVFGQDLVYLLHIAQQGLDGLI